MDQKRFDAISRLFADRRLSRRQAMQHGAAGLAAAGLATAGLKAAAAQDGTPAATAAGAEDHKTSFLFVQTFGAGSLAPKEGEEGTLTLTADHLAGQTVYFSDRPERIVGLVPTERFLGTGNSAAGSPATPAVGGIGFSSTNPPNAALVFASAAGDTAPGDVLVVELIDPTYDPATGTATFDVRVLADETAVDMTLVSEPVTAADVTRQFEAASLFIDDCPDGTVSCGITNDRYPFGYYVGDSPVMGFCYNWGDACCAPCAGNSYADWTNQCNNVFFPNECKGECQAGVYNESWACGMDN